MSPRVRRRPIAGLVLPWSGQDGVLFKHGSYAQNVLDPSGSDDPYIRFGLRLRERRIWTDSDSNDGWRRQWRDRERV